MGEKASEELIFIDSGLQNKASHNYALAKTVLRARQDGVRGFGAAEAAMPHFCLSGLDPSIAAENGAIRHLSRSL